MSILGETSQGCMIKAISRDREGQTTGLKKKNIKIARVLGSVQQWIVQYKALSEMTEKRLPFWDF